MRKIEKQIKTTMNRSVYNKAYKEKNSSCSFCKWHCGCNGDYKFYSEDGRIPNWKLVSKNRKQWMKKPLKKVLLFHVPLKDNEYYIEW